MFIGWMGVETAWCHTPPQTIEAFLYCERALHCHIRLHRDCLLGQRRLHSQLRTLMQHPIAYSTHEVEHANLYDHNLAHSMWEQPYRRAQWRQQCARPNIHCFHSGFIQQPVPPVPHSIPGARGLPLRPRKGLDYEPGHLHIKLLLPDTEGSCLCNEPWQFYARYYEPRRYTLPPTMAKAPQWTMLGTGRCATRVCHGEWWMVEGVV